MKFLKKIALVLLVVFVGIQFMPIQQNNSDATIPKTDINMVYQVPKNISAVLKTSCYDCHSNHTKYPWYAKIQPIGWFIANHIEEGKEDLNFSNFGKYSKRKQKSRLQFIANQIRDNKMPLFSYTIIHRNAKLSESLKKQVINWAIGLKSKIVD